MIAPLNKAYGLRLRTVRNAAFWLDNARSSIVAPNCLVGFLDHYGHDANNNFICEPYARTCEACHKDAKKFAQTIGATLSIDKFTFHCPWSDECIRMTFMKG